MSTQGTEQEAGQTPDPSESNKKGSQSNDQPPDEGNTPPEGQNSPEGKKKDEEEGDTFSRTYVEGLRRENQKYRDRASKSDDALSRLTTATMKEATNGILIDSDDLPYDEKTMSDDDGFPDEEKIKEAAQALIEKKPHLAYRRPKGDIGQGKRSKDEEVDLAGILRSRAG